MRAEPGSDWADAPTHRLVRLRAPSCPSERLCRRIANNGCDRRSQRGRAAVHRLRTQTLVRSTSKGLRTTALEASNEDPSAACFARCGGLAPAHSHRLRTQAFGQLITFDCPPGPHGAPCAHTRMPEVARRYFVAGRGEVAWGGVLWRAQRLSASSLAGRCGRLATSRRASPCTLHS